MARSDGVTNFYGKIACFILLAIFKEKPLGMLHLLDRKRERLIFKIFEIT